MLKDASCFKKVYLACGFTDLRKGIDQLAALVSLNFGLDPLEEGTLFLFCGRKRSTIKALCFEGDGFVLLKKRLINGVYMWPRDTREAMELTPDQYRQLMAGFTVVSAIRCPNLTDQKKTPA